MGEKGDSSSAMYGDAVTEEGAQYLIDNPDVAAEGMQPYAHYVTYGQSEGRTWGETEEEPSGSFEFDFSSLDTGFDAEEYQTMLDESQAEADEKSALGQIDMLYISKFSAANQAIDTVTEAIKEEKGYAAISGLDYNMSSAEKQERINNQFAAYWSEEEESQLEELLGEWGVENRWTSGVVRGTAASEQKAVPGKEAGGGVDPTLVFLMEEEEDEEEETTALGGAKPILGGNL